MQNTQLYPVIEIDGNWYSTNNVTVDGNYCKPILMNIPSIKESVDIESRKFKISNVSLQFNNFPFEGVRFSDQLSETSLINKEATIYFKSQSDLREVFKGIIRRLSHDDEKVSVELEDLTEKKAHKDLPSESLDDSGLLDKYKNKPIPMVYGYVDRSLLVVDTSLGANSLKADYKDISDFVSTEVTLLGEVLSPLLIEDNGEYYHIREVIKYKFGYVEDISSPIVEDVTKQYSEDGNSINLLSTDLLLQQSIQSEKSSPPNVISISDANNGTLFGGW